jgi:hypothetical protein
MPRNQNPGLDPDDRKEQERPQTVGRRGDEHEDIEDSRTRSKRDDASSDIDEEELSEADIVEEIDLDALVEGDGPDA